jgi:hypothetical protein
MKSRSDSCLGFYSPREEANSQRVNLIPFRRVSSRISKRIDLISATTRALTI